jgi:hypothetical protein
VPNSQTLLLAYAGTAPINRTTPQNASQRHRTLRNATERFATPQNTSQRYKTPLARFHSFLSCSSHIHPLINMPWRGRNKKRGRSASSSGPETKPKRHRDDNPPSDASASSSSRRGNWEATVKENEHFVTFYRTLGLMSDEEFQQFIAILKVCMGCDRYRSYQSYQVGSRY